MLSMLAMIPTVLGFLVWSSYRVERRTIDQEGRAYDPGPGRKRWTDGPQA